MTARLPDFVLIDDMLSPGESGLEVARWLAKRIAEVWVAMVSVQVQATRAQERIGNFV